MPTPISATSTEEEVITYLLGISPSDILSLSRDPRERSRIFAQAQTHLEDLTRISFADSAEVKRQKLQDYNKGMELLEAIILSTVAPSAATSGAISEYVAYTRTLVDDIVEDIRANPVIRIGRFRFSQENLGPTHIQISEVYSTLSSGTLRSSSDVTYRNPSSVTKITVDLVFAGPDQINNIFRPMLAELKVSPITTIESSIVLDSIINQFSSPEIEDEIRERVLEGSVGVRRALDHLSTEATATWASLRELLASDDLVVEYMRQRIKKKADALPAPSAVPSSYPHDDKLLTLGVSIPVTLLDLIVSTDPGATNLLHVKLVFLRHNSNAFGITGLQFRDANGDPTPDIDRCPWITKVADLVYLNSTNPDTRLGVYSPSEDTDFRCEWQDLHNKTPDGIRTFPTKDQTGKFVIESVQASINFGIAPIPVLGSKYPVTQIMGKSGVSARIVLATTSKAILREFHIMKDHLDAVARSDGGYDRDEQVKIYNGVLNLLGGHRFVITSIETAPYPDSSSAYQIEMTVAPAEYSSEMQQRVTLVNQGTPHSHIKELWDYLYSKYRQYYQSPPSAFDISDPRDSPLPRPVLLAMSLIFGDLSGTRGSGKILNNSVFIAGLVNHYSRALSLGDEEDSSVLPNFQAVVNYLERELLDPASEVLFAPRGPFVYTPSSTDIREPFVAFLNAQVLAILQSSARDIWKPQPYSPLKLRPSEGAELWEQYLLDSVKKPTNGVPVYDLKMIDPLDGTSNLGLSAIKKVMVGGFVVGANPANFHFTKEFWDSTWEILNKKHKVPRSNGESAWSNTDLQQVMGSLSSLFVSGQVAEFGDDFPLLKKIIEDEPTKVRLASPDPTTGAIEASLLSNYPDLKLPTYRDLFSEPSGALITVGGKELWKRFAPTYVDLGKEPTLTELGILRPHDARLQSPRTPDDQVEPGFWLWDYKVKERLYDGLKKTLEFIPPESRMEVNGLKSSSLVKVVDINTEEIRRLTPAIADEKIRQTIYDSIMQQSNEGSREAKRIKDGRFTNTYECIDSQGQLCAILEPKADSRGEKFTIRVINVGAPIYVNDTLGVAYNRQSGKKARALTRSVIDRLKDTTFSFIRHYPAFRLYFVETDNTIGQSDVASGGSEVRLIDDLYTTNAVLDIKITHNKRDASTAIVRLLNTNGNLDRDEFMTTVEQEARTIGADDEGEDYLTRLKLKTGTGIQIRMGYSTNPDDLDIVFTGQIAEISNGPIVEFVAQSYKTEMFQEVNLYEGNANPRMVMHKLLTKMPLPHMGRLFDIRSVSDAQFEKIAGFTARENQSTGIFGITGQRGFLARIFGSSFTTATRNIWFESNFDINTPVGEFIRDVGETVGNLVSLPWITGPDHYWLFDRVTLWDAFDEIGRHHPGHICDVRPFDTEATLFFGLPDQPYLYRQQTVKERYLYQKYLNYVQPVRLNKIAAELLDGFAKSEYGTTVAQTEAQWLDFVGKYSVQKYYRRDLPDTPSLRGVRVAINEKGLSGVWPSWTAFIRHINNPTFRKEAYGTYNFTPYTTTLDFTSDWDKIASYSPELLRFLTSFFFGIKYDLWPAGLEGLWPHKFREWMAPLSTLKDADVAEDYLEEGDLQTLAGRDMFARLAGSEAGISIPRSSVEGRVINPDIGDLSLVGGSVVAGPASDAFKAMSAELQSRLLSIVPHKDVSLGRHIFENFPLFRVFLHYFAKYIGQPTVMNAKTEAHQAAFDQLNQGRIPPGFRTFRNYHYVTDRNDIISNDIEATNREMANTVMLKCPTEQVYFDEIDNVEGGGSATVIETTQEWVYFPNERGVSFHPDIDASNRILRLAEEPNANRRQAQGNCLMSQMGAAIRPMYRGQLKLIGRDIWPWDVVYLADSYNLMTGPVEVDTVVHEFSRETGWVTTIEPHALVTVNSPSDKYQSSVIFDVLSLIDAAATVLTVIGIGVAVKAAIAAGVGAARLVTKAVAQDVVKKAVKKGMIRGALKTATTTARLARGTKVAANFTKMLSSLGRVALTYGISNNVLEPMHQLISNLYFKMNFEGELWPVDVLPLVFKGMPYYAGIPLSDREVFTFWEAFSGSLRDLYREFDMFFSGKTADNAYFGLGE